MFVTDNALKYTIVILSFFKTSIYLATFYALIFGLVYSVYFLTVFLPIQIYEYSLNNNKVSVCMLLASF